MPARAASPVPLRRRNQRHPWWGVRREHARRGIAAGLALGLVCSAGACSSEPTAGSQTSGGPATGSVTSGTAGPGSGTDSPTSGSAGSTASGSLPPGSGATAPGITPTTPAAIVPQGSTKANIACRQIYPVVTEAITAWNAANNRDIRSELQSANVALSRAADTIGGHAAASGDSRLVALTGAVSTQIKKVVSDYSNDRDVNGGPVQQATDALWKYCETTR